MTSKRNKLSTINVLSLYVILTIGIIGFTLVSICIGVSDITVGNVFNIICSRLGITSLAEEISHGQEMIIINLRVPRVLMALLVGINLSTTGAVYQALFRNDMADPYMLGISAGASFGAGIGIMINGFLPMWAFMGAIFANILVIVLAGVKGRVSTIRLLLAGLAINYFFSAVLSYLKIQSEDSQMAMFAWGMGTLAGSTYKRLIILGVITLIVVVVFMTYRKELNMLLLGEEVAISMGVSTHKVMWVLFGTSSLLIATTVAFTGTIGFVGLIIPHIVRIIFGSDYKKTIPICMFLGMYFVLFCDDIARSVIPNKEVPIGIITSLIGAPYFMWLLHRNRRAR